MEQTPRRRFASRLEEKHEDDEDAASEFSLLARGFALGALPTLVGFIAVVLLLFKTIAVQAPILFAGVVLVIAAGAFVGWRHARPNRERSLTRLDS